MLPKGPSLQRPFYSVLLIAWLVALTAFASGQDPSGRPGRKPPVKRPVAPVVETKPTVILTVLSDPPESTLYLNGEQRGSTGAEGKIVLEKLALGHYSVEVRKDGFTSQVRGFEAGRDSPTLVFKLEPRFDDVTREFDSLVAGGKLLGPEVPNAFALVTAVDKKYPDRPEIARMRGVLSAKLVEKIVPLINRSITGWRTLTRDELSAAQESAAHALLLKSDDSRLQAQAAYLRAILALRDWQTGASSSSSGPSGEGGGTEGPENGERLAAAQQDLEKAVAFDNAWAAAWYQLGIVRLHKAELSGAETAFNKVAQLEPRWAIAPAGLGSTYHAWAKYKEAIEAYRKAIDLDKNYSAAFAGLGFARFARGDKDGIKDIRKAMELDSTAGLPHLYLGTIYSKSKKKDELGRAVVELQQAVQKNPANLEFQNRAAEQLIAELQKAKK
jgi:tetratricopeptide (TPR) repeat protein